MSIERSADVAEAIKSIEEFYALGGRLPPRVKLKETYGLKVVAGEAKREGENPDTIRKARAFAAQGTGFTKREVAELCQMIRTVQPKQKDKKPIFRRTHIICLLRVSDKAERTTLQKEAIRGAWSTARLETAIARRYGTRREGGRKSAAMTTVEDWLTHAEKMCETWRRWVAQLDAEPGPKDKPWVRRKDLPDSLSTDLPKTTKQVLALHELVLHELGVRVPGYQPRPGVLATSSAKRR